MAICVDAIGSGSGLGTRLKLVSVLPDEYHDSLPVYLEKAQKWINSGAGQKDTEMKV